MVKSVSPPLARNWYVAEVGEVERGDDPRRVRDRGVPGRRIAAVRSPAPHHDLRHQRLPSSV